MTRRERTIGHNCKRIVIAQNDEAERHRNKKLRTGGDIPDIPKRYTKIKSIQHFCFASLNFYTLQKTIFVEDIVNTGLQLLQSWTAHCFHRKNAPVTTTMRWRGTTSRKEKHGNWVYMINVCIINNINKITSFYHQSYLFASCVFLT